MTDRAGQKELLSYLDSAGKTGVADVRLIRPQGFHRLTPYQLDLLKALSKPTELELNLHVRPAVLQARRKATRKGSSRFPGGKPGPSAATRNHGRSASKVDSSCSTERRDVSSALSWLGRHFSGRK